MEADVTSFFIPSYWEQTYGKACQGSRGVSASNDERPQNVIRSDLGQESARWRAALKSGEA
jgi:hypothetical protein